MIPNLAYTSKSLYISNYVKSKPIYLLGLRAIDLHTEKFLLFSQYSD